MKSTKQKKQALHEAINECLYELRTSVPGVKLALVTSNDGLLIASSTIKGDPDLMAAIVASAIGMGKKILEAFESGELDELAVRGEEKTVFLFSVAKRGALAILAPPEINVGLINVVARNTAHEIEDLLKQAGAIHLHKPAHDASIA